MEEIDGRKVVSRQDLEFCVKVMAAVAKSLEDEVGLLKEIGGSDKAEELSIRADIKLLDDASALLTEFVADDELDEVDDD